MDAAALEQEFRALAEKWREDTMVLSVSHDIVFHPAYQRIIGMGRPALPLILRELQNRLDHWFWALHCISGEDPAREEDTIDGAARAWLDWGKQRGYISA